MTEEEFRYKMGSLSAIIVFVSGVVRFYFPESDAAFYMLGLAIYAAIRSVK